MNPQIIDSLKSATMMVVGVGGVEAVNTVTGSDAGTIDLILKLVVVIATSAKPIYQAVKALAGLFKRVK